MTKQNKRLTAILVAVGMILLIPLTAMQFTDEVKWSGFDFLVAAILLGGTGLGIELVLRKITKTSHRLLLCAALLFLLLLVWAELAVGIFGTPFAGS